MAERFWAGLHLFGLADVSSAEGFLSAAPSVLLYGKVGSVVGNWRVRST